MLTIKMVRCPPSGTWLGFVKYHGINLVWREHRTFCTAWKRARAEQVNTSTALGL